MCIELVYSVLTVTTLKTITHMLLLNKTELQPLEPLARKQKPGLFVSENQTHGEGSELAEVLSNARIAAEAHRRARYAVQSILKPGVSLLEVVNTIENATRAMLPGELNSGVGFPTGISLNDCAAHFTLNPGDEDIFLKSSDVLKVDFGTHVGGTIMDSAFTVAFDPAFEPLLQASQEATAAGIRALGVDVRLSDIGAVIAETMSGFEITYNGKTLPVRPVANLCGHSIEKYKIHGGLSIPNVRNKDKAKIKANTFYAIETFATTGKGEVRNAPNTSHYMLKPGSVRRLTPQSQQVLNVIKEKFQTLPFCPRYVDRYISLPNGSLPSIKSLASIGALEPYPPLVDIANSHVAQFEHTIFLSEFAKEILTKGDDY